MVFEAIDIFTDEIVKGVGYCPTNEKISVNKKEITKEIGYLFTGDNTQWIDGVEFSIYDDFYVVYRDSVRLINK